MKRLGFRSAFVSTVGKVDLKTKSSQATEPQLFYIVCYALAVCPALPQDTKIK